MKCGGELTSIHDGLNDNVISHIQFACQGVDEMRLQFHEDSPASILI